MDEITVTINNAKEVCSLLNEIKKLLEYNHKIAGECRKVILDKVNEVRQILKGAG